ncbi:hypothetical protein BHE74_00036884 [Ensete ventricosum]|nr:hypothetical protein BHE74_00036884 [Ensete ventricosum]
MGGVARGLVGLIDSQESGVGIRAKAQLFCHGLLCPPLAKEIYTTPFEALHNDAIKNLVIVTHLLLLVFDVSPGVRTNIAFLQHRTSLWA